MVETKLQIGDVSFIDTHYGESYAGAPIKDTSIMYRNVVTDHYHGTYNVDYSITEQQAKDIINFLQKAFNL